MTWRCSLASASNVKENENVSLLWAADYFGRPSFLLTICNLPPIFEWQILQIGIMWHGVVPVSEPFRICYVRMKGSIDPYRCNGCERDVAI